MTAAGGTWPRSIFDIDYYSATDPVAGVLNSYLWSSAGTAVNSSGYPAGTKVPEAVS